MNESKFSVSIVNGFLFYFNNQSSLIPAQVNIVQLLKLSKQKIKIFIWVL